MAGGSPISRRLAPAWRAGYLLVLLVLSALAGASGPSAAQAAAADPAVADPAVADLTAADSVVADAADADAAGGDAPLHPPSFGPPGQTPGVPSHEELEAAGAVIGEVLIDNQNIFNLEDPKDDNWLL